MDEKKKIIKAIVLIIVIIACIPVKSHIKDGGSENYHALLYSVTKVHRLTMDEDKLAMGINYDTGYEVDILGIPVIDTSGGGMTFALQKKIPRTMVETWNGKEPVEGNEWLKGEVGGKTVYQDVPTEVNRFYWSEAADMPPYIIVYERQTDGTVLCWKEEYDSDEQLDLHEVDGKVMDRISKWVDTYDVKSWDGFDMSDTGVCDGWGFRLNITLSTGETIEAHGYMVYPDGFSEAKGSIEDLIY